MPNIEKAITDLLKGLIIKDGILDLNDINQTMKILEQLGWTLTDTSMGFIKTEPNV